jgi:UDPglucose--hexose-1-phosphate uridylyltransferase
MIKTEMRLDPLRQTWTAFAPGRATRPNLLARHQNHPRPSPFLEGREHLTPHTLHQSGTGGKWNVRVFPNRAAALRVEGDPAIHADGFYDRMEGVGAHEIIVEAPDSTPFEQLPLPHLTEVISAWKIRIADLMRDSRLRAFFIIKDAGAPAGAAYEQAFSQLVAMAAMPAALKQKLKTSRQFYDQKHRSLFEDILAEETRSGKRLVYENSGFTAFCPYASRTPFELAIYPKRQCADFHAISPEETAQLADTLKTLLLKLNHALAQPAYHLMLTTAPSRTARRDQWNTIDHDFRWHIEILPRLYPITGLELGTGSSFNSVLPETAAAFLRNLEI